MVSAACRALFPGLLPALFPGPLPALFLALSQHSSRCKRGGGSEFALTCKGLRAPVRAPPHAQAPPARPPVILVEEGLCDAAERPSGHFPPLADGLPSSLRFDQAPQQCFRHLRVLPRPELRGVLHSLR